MSDLVVVYTDGACLVPVRHAATPMTREVRGSSGLGGWAWWVHDNLWGSGAEPDTTNNRMELMAVIQALEGLRASFEGTSFASSDLEVVSDSAYVVNCFADQWYVNWRRNGWRNSNNKPVQNQDLWQALLYQYEDWPGAITFRHIRGHGRGGPADGPYVAGNDKADKLAVAARKTLER